MNTIRCAERQNPGHDNIEEKQVVDALGTYFLLSDNGLYLDTYHTTARGERDCTFLFLMDRDRFPGWIVKRQPPAPVSKNETVSAMEFRQGKKLAATT